MQVSSPSSSSSSSIWEIIVVVFNLWTIGG